MPSSSPLDAPHPLSPGRAWLVGGCLASVALGSLATALALRGPGVAADEPRETIVSTLSPSPRRLAAATMAEGPPAPGRAEPVTGPGPATRPAACTDCGIVRAVTAIERRGDGVAGHPMEHRLRSSTEYRVRVQMADGGTRTLSHPTRLAVGEAVRVDGDRLLAQTRPAPAVAGTRTAQSAPAGDEPAARPRSMAEAKRL